MTFIRKKQAVKLNPIEAINTMQNFRTSSFKKRPAMKNWQWRKGIGKYNIGVKNKKSHSSVFLCYWPLYVYKILITYCISGNYLKPSFITLLNVLHNFIPNNQSKTDSVKTLFGFFQMLLEGCLFWNCQNNWTHCSINF